MSITGLWPTGPAGGTGAGGGFKRGAGEFYP